MPKSLALPMSIFLLSAVSSGQIVDIAPLEVRDLSLANTTAPALKNADPNAVTTDLGPKTIPWLLASAQKSYWDLPGSPDPELVFRRGAVPTGSKIDGFFEMPWLARAVSAYLRVREQATPGQRDSLERWFAANARFALWHMQLFLKLNFPNREQEDHSLRKGMALVPNYLGMTTTFQGDSIANISQWYNNRRAMTNLYMALVGVALSRTQPKLSDSLVREVKRYHKEWVTYSVYPGGECGEWARNHEYPNADSSYIEGQGLTYNAYNSASALTSAIIFARFLHDSDLVTWRTREGLWGTESGIGEPDKSIWTASDLHIDLLVGAQSRTNRVDSQIQVRYDYAPPETYKRNELRHATWYLPAYRALRKGDSAAIRLERWYAGLDLKARADDPFGLWHDICGISQDVRTEDFAWLAPIPETGIVAKRPMDLKVRRMGRTVRVESNDGSIGSVALLRLDGSVIAAGDLREGAWEATAPAGAFVIRIHGANGSWTQLGI